MEILSESERTEEISEREFWYAHLVLKSSVPIYKKAGDIIYSSEIQRRERNPDGQIANEYVYLCKVPSDLIAEKRTSDINEIVNAARFRKSALIRKREIELIYEEANRGH
jgi:hypothetical protein